MENISVSEILLDLELKLANSPYRNDSQFLEYIIDDAFIEIGSSGNEYTKKIVMDSLVNSEDSSIIEINCFSILEIGVGIYLSKYRTSKNGEICIRSSIWKYDNRNWKIIFHQGTKAL